MSIDASTIVELLQLLKGDHVVKLEKLSTRFEQSHKVDRKQLLHVHLITVDPVLEVGMPTPATLFEELFHMVYSLDISILGLNNDSKIDDATMALLMMIFPMDRRPPIMFQ